MVVPEFDSQGEHDTTRPRLRISLGQDCLLIDKYTANEVSGSRQATRAKSALANVATIET